jgi:hypothetical protein
LLWSRLGIAPPFVAMNKVAAWSIIIVMWSLLLPLGVVCALALPLNLVLVPCWLAAAGAIGRLPEVLLDKRPAAATAAEREERAPARVVLT